MKVLVIGSGAREHALIWKLSQSRRVSKLYALPGNGGTRDLAETVDIDPSDVVSAADFAEKEGIALTVVGPEQPLSLGITDAFHKRGLKIFGPTQKAAMLESSKVFSKEFMRRNSIPTAPFQVFTSAEEARLYLEGAVYPLVIKADGLAGGKGVFICKDKAEALQTVRAVLVEHRFGQAGEKILIEDFLPGTEMSFMVISDGKRAVPLVTAMDYKKAQDGDQGPNTGGMGAISPAPGARKALCDRIMGEIIYPVLEGMRLDGREFRGVLYAGLMLVEDAPHVLEFNVRFGDPETQPIMLRLKSDLLDLLEAGADGNLHDVAVEWSEQVSAGVVLTSRGYPGSFETGNVIQGLERAKAMGVEIFHAGTRLEQGKLLSAGGRVLTLCASGVNLKETVRRIYDAIGFVGYENICFRQDIGKVKE